MSYTSSRILPRFIAAPLTAPALIAAAVFAAPTAHADTTETGPDGQELTVSETSVDPNGSKVTVTGTGYREDVGIYVAVCVIPAAGEAPGPCLGGVNMEGESGGSYWIASDPPAYAEGLTIPFEAGGSFEVELAFAADDDHTDCLDPTVAPQGCAISTRADHTRGSDRSADVLIPLTFDAGEPHTLDSDSEPADDSDDPNAEPEVDDDAVEEPATQAGDENDADASADVQNETEDTANNTGLIILIVAGVLGLIAGVSAVAFHNRKKRAAAREAAREQDGGE